MRRKERDGAMTKDERYLLKKKLQDERDKWDAFICTGYKRVYPNPDKEKNKLYNSMLDQAKLLFNDFSTQAKAGSGGGAFNRADSKNMAKTNPIPKAKAADLKSHVQTPQKSMNNTA